MNKKHGQNGNQYHCSSFKHSNYGTLKPLGHFPQNCWEVVSLKDCDNRCKQYLYIDHTLWHVSVSHRRKKAHIVILHDLSKEKEAPTHMLVINCQSSFIFPLEKQRRTAWLMCRHSNQQWLAATRDQHINRCHNSSSGLPDQNKPSQRNTRYCLSF